MSDRRYLLDADARRHGRALIGGSPLKLFRLTGAGALAVDRIEAGEVVPRLDARRRARGCRCDPPAARSPGAVHRGRRDDRRPRARPRRRDTRRGDRRRRRLRHPGRGRHDPPGRQPWTGRGPQRRAPARGDRPRGVRRCRRHAARRLARPAPPPLRRRPGRTRRARASHRRRVVRHSNGTKSRTVRSISAIARHVCGREAG